MTTGFVLGLISLIFGFLGSDSSSPQSVSLVQWESAKVFDVPTDPDPQVEAIVQQYLTRLRKLGYDPNRQGVWIQSQWAELGQNHPYIPLSAASLTKIATSLVALDKWGTEHRFETRIYTTGTLENGVISGDLIIEGGYDPFLVWEEAIAIGNALNELGIQEIKGNLIVTDGFDFNFQENLQKSAESFKLALNSDQWTAEVEKAYQDLPPMTPRPQVVIQGTVQKSFFIPQSSLLRLRHQSLTLAEILKQMNIYSNNAMSEMLAQALGGPQVVAQTAAQIANFDLKEIQLMNGSGLGIENRISPRAATQMLIALEDKLKNTTLSVGDLFPVAGRDTEGTMQWRAIPQGVAVKTGTLNQVSALAGVIPTQERGQVWFALINDGSGIERLRAEQDRFLQQLANHWQITPQTTLTASTGQVFLGDPVRNRKQ